jgi:hypothetical protein
MNSHFASIVAVLFDLNLKTPIPRVTLGLGQRPKIFHFQ